MVETIFLYLWKAILTTLAQIGIFFVPGLIFTVVVNYVSTLLQKRALLTIGRGWFLGLFGWLGTIIHELGHAFFCIVFRHKITEMKLFDPDPETGTLGYVQHTYEPSSPYQTAGNFFVGIGPILIGAALIYLALFLLLRLNPFNFAVNSGSPSSGIYSWNVLYQVLQSLLTSSKNLFSGIFVPHNFTTWQIYLFFYLTFTIGSSIILSPSDIKGALKGLVVILILVLVFNLATVWAGDFTGDIFTATLSYFIIFYIAFLIILLMDIIVFILLLPLSLLRRNSGNG